MCSNNVPLQDPQIIDADDQLQVLHSIQILQHLFQLSSVVLI